MDGRACGNVWQALALVSICAICPNFPLLPYPEDAYLLLRKQRI